MRVTALAELPSSEYGPSALPVYLYILAKHRVDGPPEFQSASMGWSNLKYADWVSP